MKIFPEHRARPANNAPIASTGRYVLYWMTTARRTRFNFGLQRAADWSRQLRRPLLVFEALRCGYRWASARFHRFVLDGMRDNRAACEAAGVRYYPYVEPEEGAGSGLLEALARDAALVVTDDYPCSFVPRMVSATAARLPVFLEEVDSNGVFPMRKATRLFQTAYSFRRYLQTHLPAHLEELPREDPLAGAHSSKARIAREITQRWPAANDRFLAGELTPIPIDHAVAPTTCAGGSFAASEQLATFLETRLARYDEDRNQPERTATSELSPYLHFGHIASAEVVTRLLEREEWSADDLSPDASGKRAGWWGTSEAAEGFLDQIVTWRELGFNFCSRRDDYDRYESLPQWALDTLEQHAKDSREYVYSFEELETACTHDSLWNAAQTQLVEHGKIHNYLRMLWGKKILEWSSHPRVALERMVALNDKYALDGRDPNSYSGICWILGRYDRPWGPERPVFGKVRYMSSANTARKMSVRGYIRAHSPETATARS